MLDLLHPVRCWGWRRRDGRITPCSGFVQRRYTADSTSRTFMWAFGAKPPAAATAVALASRGRALWKKCILNSVLPDTTQKLPRSHSRVFKRFCTLHVWLQRRRSHAWDGMHIQGLLYIAYWYTVEKLRLLIGVPACTGLSVCVSTLRRAEAEVIDWSSHDGLKMQGPAHASQRCQHGSRASLKR